MIVSPLRGCQSRRGRWAVCGLLWLFAPPGHAALLDRLITGPRGTSNITLRKRLHVNTLITEPGTVEAEWDNLYSYSSGNFSMPSIIKYTPMGKSILWGRTEYSAAFDSIDSVAQAGQRSTQFSDRVTFAANAVLRDGEKLDIAIQPGPGTLIAWNNADRDGAPNPLTAHAGNPVIRGAKYIVTKWYRCRAFR